MLSRPFFLLIFLISCSSFQSETSLLKYDAQELLTKVKLEGEGRGRLSVRENQNVFSFETVLKENFDWLMAISIPLHGEEVMIFPELNLETAPSERLEAFEVRLEDALAREFPKGEISGKEFISSLRKMVRFLLAPKLKLERNCKIQDEKQLCVLDNETFEVEVNKADFRVKMVSKESFSLEARSQILTGPFFQQTKFSLVDPEGKKDRLGLELFWK